MYILLLEDLCYMICLYNAIMEYAGLGVQSQTTSVGSSKTLRLFGVNLECQLDDEWEGSESQAQAEAHRQFNYSVEAYNSESTNRRNHHMVGQFNCCFITTSLLLSLLIK